MADDVYGNSEMLKQIEAIKQEGSEFFMCRELHRLTAICREVGVSRDELGMTLISHALGLCRPNPLDRQALARFLRRQARLLEPTAEEKQRW
jgi:hypothetical protein